METIKIAAELRSEGGKGPAKRLRREGKVPAIAYGKQLGATSVAISPKGLLQVLGSKWGQNTVVELGISDGKSLIVMLRDYTVHPTSRELLHADFLEIKLDQPIDVEVPFNCTGKPAGVVLGGVLRQVYRSLPIRCLPEQIPTLIEYDVTALDLGDHVKTNELKLPEGVTVRLPADQTVAGVVAPEKDRTEDAAAPGVPGAAAPAAGAAAPAAAAGKESKAPPAKKK